jgi:hypothetical protein
MSNLTERDSFLDIPIIKLADLPDGAICDPCGLIYSDRGKLIGKKTDFIFNQSIPYQKEIILFETGKRRFELINWQDLNSIVFPKENWRIKQLIPKSGIVILASPSGEKKSWVAMEMARCITVGENFIGNENFEVEPGNVLYINGEMSKQELQRRGRQLDFTGKTYNIFIITQDSINLGEAEAVEEIKDLILSNNIGIVFIDTLRAVAGKLKEEKAEEVREFFNRLMPLKNLGITIVFLDHCRKPQRFEGKEPRKEQLFSSQDKVANAEILLMLKSEAGTDDISVYQKKNRLSKEIQPFRILMEDQKDEVGITRTTKLTYAGNFEEKEYKLDEAKELVLGALADGPKVVTELIELGKIEEIGEKNVRNAIRSLLEHKRISKIGKRKQAFIYDLSKVDGQKIDLETTPSGKIAELFNSI